MKLLNLQVHQFRNIEKAEVDFPTPLTIFQGQNAQGKTNLLEAIAMLVMGKSFRTREDKQILPWDSPLATTVVRGRILQDSGITTIHLGLKKNRKQVVLNGEPLKRLGDLLGQLRAVLFLPDDLDLVHGPPALRRRLLDSILIQVDRNHLDSLQRYDNALKNRNSLLRTTGTERPINPDTLVALQTYEAILSQHGPAITRRRQAMLEELSPILSESYGTIRGSGLEIIAVKFRAGYPDPEIDENQIRAKYLRQRETDRYRGSASMGSHRDDFDLSLNAQSAANFASQGQRRSIVLAMKLAQVAYLLHLTGAPPLLLMDDIFSELDCSRQNALLKALPHGTQTILTATDATPLHFAEASHWTVENGRITHWQDIRT